MESELHMCILLKQPFSCQLNPAGRYAAYELLEPSNFSLAMFLVELDYSILLINIKLLKFLVPQIDNNFS